MPSQGDEASDIDSAGVYFVSVAEFEARATPEKRGEGHSGEGPHIETDDSAEEPQSS